MSPDVPKVTTPATMPATVPATVPAMIPPRPAQPDEAWSVRRTTWEADPVLHPEVRSAIALTIEAPGHYATPDAVSLYLETSGGPHTRGAVDRARIECFWWELEALASGLAALIEQARRDGTVPARPRLER